MNFVLLSSRTKETGLEVSCKGEVVRLENHGEECQAALAVKFSDYRLLPLEPGRSNVDEQAVQSEAKK